MKKKVIIIGGGAAGMMAAGTAAKQGAEVHLYEKNDALGRKIFITGKGRCNFTNASDIENFIENTIRNPFFLYSAIYTFTNEDLISFFDKWGVPSKVERGNRVFPKSDKSNDIIKALNKFMASNKVNLHLGQNIEKILKEGNGIKGIQLESGEKIYGDKVLLATGGLSYPKTGSTGHGLKMAKQIGHNIIEPFPSLVPIVVKENWIGQLQGLSLKNVEISLFQGKKLIRKEFGEMVFTHYGLSGPIVLSLSAYIKKPYPKHSLCLNLKPALTEEQLDNRLQRDFQKYSRKQYKNALHDLLPKKLIPIIINLSNIDENKYVHQITKEERKRLIHLIQALPLNVETLRPISTAIVTGGGIDTNEINPSTMESKIISGLYFAGEVIDVDALTGGYNLQIAFSTGYLAGINL